MKQIYTPDGLLAPDYHAVADDVAAAISKLFRDHADVEPRQLAFLIISDVTATQAGKSIDIALDHADARGAQRP